MLYYSQGLTSRATSSPSAGVHVPRSLQSTPHQSLGFSQIHRSAKSSTHTDPFRHSVKGRRYSSPRPKSLTPNSDDTDVPSPPKLRRSRTQSSSNKFDSFSSSNFFTPLPSPPVVVPRSRSSAAFPTKKSCSSPALTQSQLYNSKGYIQGMPPDSDDERGEDEAIYTSWDGPRNLKPNNNLRTRIFGGPTSTSAARGRDKPKSICTTPGQLCAGETETEADEPVSVQLRISP